MPKLNSKIYVQAKRKEGLVKAIRAYKGMNQYTEEEMGKRLLGLGRMGYRNRVANPGKFTLQELFMVSDVLKVSLPELLGYTSEKNGNTNK